MSLNEMLFVRLTLALLVMGLFSPVKAMEWDRTQIENLKTQLKENRQKIRSYQVELVSIYHANKTQNENRFLLFKDGSKRLIEHNNVGMNKRTIYCFNGTADGFFFKYTYNPKANINLGEYDKIKNLDKEPRFDFETIGLELGLMNPERGKTYSEAIDDLFQSYSEGALVEKVTLGNKECLRLIPKVPNQGQKLSIYVDLELGPNIRQIEAETKGLQEKRIIEYEQHSSGFWYPSKMEYEKSFGQNKYTESVQIFIKSINTVIDPKLFEPAGMNLDKGGLILNNPIDPNKQLIVSDNSLLVPPDTYGKPEPEPKEPSKWWGRVAVATCVLTLIFGFLYLKQRRIISRLKSE
jgi:outer membrane lipoprotein-sorting protein